MRDVLAAVWIRALAFTPGLWLRLSRLSQPAGRRDRRRCRKVLLVFALPLTATFVTSGVATVVDAAKGNLYVNADRTVVVTIETGTEERSLLSCLSAIGAIAVALAVTTVPAALGGYVVWATASSLEAALAMTGVFILGTFSAPMYRYSTLVVHRPCVGPQTGDLVATGFARHPAKAPSTSPIATLNTWLPRGSWIHGVAFESLLPTYSALASRRGHVLNRRLIGEKWVIGRTLLRENLYEIRA